MYDSICVLRTLAAVVVATAKTATGADVATVLAMAADLAENPVETVLAKAKGELDEAFPELLGPNAPREVRDGLNDLWGKAWDALLDGHNRQELGDDWEHHRKELLREEAERLERLRQEQEKLRQLQYAENQRLATLAAWAMLMVALAEKRKKNEFVEALYALAHALDKMTTALAVRKERLATALTAFAQALRAWAEALAAGKKMREWLPLLNNVLEKFQDVVNLLSRVPTPRNGGGMGGLN